MSPGVQKSEETIVTNKVKIGSVRLGLCYTWHKRMTNCRGTIYMRSLETSCYMSLNLWYVNSNNWLSLVIIISKTFVTYKYPLNTPPPPVPNVAYLITLCHCSLCVNIKVQSCMYYWSTFLLFVLGTSTGLMFLIFEFPYIKGANTQYRWVYIVQP